MGAMSIRVRTIDDFTAQEIAAMPKTARPIGRRQLNEQQIREKYADRVRHGKTARERARRAGKAP